MKITKLLVAQKITFLFFLTIILSTSQLIAQNLVYGQTYKLENTWMNKGVYLDVNGQGCQDNYLCVSTTRDNKRKNSNTSDWIILSASGKSDGQAVLNGDMIMLKNPWMRSSYLGTRGYSKNFGCAGNLCVSTYANIDNYGSTTWQVSGDTKMGGTIQFIGQWNNASAGYLDINGNHKGGGFKVGTAIDGRIKQASSMWRFVKNGNYVTSNLAEKSPAKVYKRPMYDKMTASASLKNNRLNIGEELVSRDNSVVLKMQYDGNLAMYKNGRYIWDAKTANKGHHLILQTDGNLVIYDRNNNPVWNSETMSYFNKKYANPVNKCVELNLLSNGTFVLINIQGKVMWKAPN